MSMKVLFFGDVCGPEGIEAVTETLPKWKAEHQPDLVIANAENADRAGTSKDSIQKLGKAGVEAFTSGDHFRDKGFSDLLDYPIVRPENLNETHPGVGVRVVETALHKKVLLINLLGKVMVKHDVRNYFDAIDEILSAHDDDSLAGIFVDFHATMTSEEQALGFYVDGRVSALVGTHTHVPTADTRVLPNGTAFQSDVGMCGSLNSVIGMGVDRSYMFLRRELGEDVVMPPHKKGLFPKPYFCDAVLIDVIDRHKSRSITRLTTRQ